MLGPGPFQSDELALRRKGDPGERPRSLTPTPALHDRDAQRSDGRCLRELCWRGVYSMTISQYFMSIARRSPFPEEGIADTIPTTMGVVTPAVDNSPSESLHRSPFSLTLRLSPRV